MENKVTIFSVLSLPPECTAEQVKKKCQELLLKLHPDKNGGHEIEDYQKVALIWRQISCEPDVPAFLNRERSKAKSVSAFTGARMASSDIRLSDLVVEVVDVDGIDVEAFVSECRCGGSFVLTLDTVTETKRSVDKWNVECDTCSLLMTVVNN